MIHEDILENIQQWVCLQCGYNMIGEMPDVCPFCGARHDQFMSWDRAEAAYRVITHRVNDVVGQLLSEPKLGLEHAAYRIETPDGAVWIDSPSAFNRTLAPVQGILFTHNHFLGASNQYRRIWNADIWLHELDAKHGLVNLFDIDCRFTGDFTHQGIEAHHVGGHTPGFTLYIYRDVLFICDYVFMAPTGMRFNPFGPEVETRRQAQRIYEIVGDKPLQTVCGYNYIAGFADWLPEFERLVSAASGKSR